MIKGIELASFSPDDAGNGEAFSACYVDEFLYVHEWGWMHYTGTHWELDTGNLRARKAAYKLLRKRRKAFARDNPSWHGDADDQYHSTRASNGNANGCLTSAQVHMHTQIRAFNNNPDVLNVKNGVLCLKTLTLTPHNFNDQRFTYCIPVEYKPTADMSKWLQFLGQVAETNENQENQQIALRFFQLCAGYSITGHTNEEIALYLFGPLRSGKGTTMETLQALLPHPLSGSICN